MQVTSEQVGEGFKYQLQINVTLGLPVELKVVCHSANRNDTSYEIFDQHGVSMGDRRFTYASRNKKMTDSLVDNLNVLLDEFSVRIDPIKFGEVSDMAARRCESLYGNGRQDGDVIITLK